VEYCPKYYDGKLQDFKCFSSALTCIVNATISAEGNFNETLNKNANYFIGYESDEKIDRVCLPSHATLRNGLRPYS
jgi:hypothetical protein